MLLIESLHEIKQLKKGDFFVEHNRPFVKIGQVIKGVLRGFIHDNNGDEITTHFYHEADMLFGNYIPNVNASISIQALEECTISLANFNEIMSYVNKDEVISKVINNAFHNLNAKLQSRLVSLLNLNSTEKYELFLQEYPSLINRIPHYYIANYLGITPTQLTRARKDFINKCKRD